MNKNTATGLGFAIGVTVTIAALIAWLQWWTALQLYGILTGGFFLTFTISGILSWLAKDDPGRVDGPE